MAWGPEAVTPPTLSSASGASPCCHGTKRGKCDDQRGGPGGPAGPPRGGPVTAVGRSTGGLPAHRPEVRRAGRERPRRVVRRARQRRGARRRRRGRGGRSGAPPVLPHGRRHPEPHRSGGRRGRAQPPAQAGGDRPGRRLATTRGGGGAGSDLSRGSLGDVEEAPVVVGDGG